MNNTNKIHLIIYGDHIDIIKVKLDLKIKQK